LLRSTITFSVKLEDGLALLEVDGQDVPLGNVTQVLGPADDTTDTGDPADGGDSESGDGTDAGTDSGSQDGV
jgi:hypothetical protein